MGTEYFPSIFKMKSQVRIKFDGKLTSVLFHFTLKQITLVKIKEGRKKIPFHRLSQIKSIDSLNIQVLGRLYHHCEGVASDW
jgi:hypothetical protein